VDARLRGGRSSVRHAVGPLRARPFATGCMPLSAGMYTAMMVFPADFAYWPFAAVMFVSGISLGLFASPNTASIMNLFPACHRGRPWGCG